MKNTTTAAKAKAPQTKAPTTTAARHISKYEKYKASHKRFRGITVQEWADAYGIARHDTRYHRDRKIEEGKTAEAAWSLNTYKIGFVKGYEMAMYDIYRTKNKAKKSKKI